MWIIGYNNYVKKLYSRFLILFLTIFLISCTNLDEDVPIEEYNSEVSLYENQLEEAKSSIAGKDKEIEKLNKQLDYSNSKIDLTEEELVKYKDLIINLNELLSNVYYGYAENNNYISDGFTAFSIKYKDKYYLITAGHCVHYKYEGLDTGLYTKIKFRQNNGNWVYPKLLTYENDYINNRDYAILYSDKINNGLDFDINDSNPKFILGKRNINTIKNFSICTLEDKESGSPIIDIDGEVIEIATGTFVDIDLVIEAIDKIN